ncbi:tripartite motif-containing protein 43-like [Sarcophilus harrisii]|uniref:tripartite motif-containing protein 43-like n=1 Tax=Sarcophilus harrisii TaxID=9305 RepID=UPI0013020A65|nr:tripartite motif-containing protein 43-like [Sarcophilus harrisii]
MGEKTDLRRAHALISTPRSDLGGHPTANPGKHLSAFGKGNKIPTEFQDEEEKQKPMAQHSPSEDPGDRAGFLDYIRALLGLQAGKLGWRFGHFHEPQRLRRFRDRRSTDIPTQSPSLGSEAPRTWIMADEVQEGLCINCSKEDINLIRVECGHNICMSCFRNKTSPPLCCIICWEFSHLRTRVDMAMYPEGEGMCEIHREDLKLFCERKKTLLCVTCSKSGSHDNHIHWPIAVAALCYRKKLLWQIEVLSRNRTIVQKILLKEKERPLVWAVAWNDFTNRGGIFQKVLKQVWEYLPWKKANEEKFIVGKNKKFNELNQRLKEMETIQEHQVMQKKKEWETMMSNQSRCLTSMITELEEKLHKPDIAVLQDVAETLERSCIQLNLQPFIPRVDVSYITMVTEFLKVFESKYQSFGQESLGHRLAERVNFYDLSEEKKRAIRIVPGFSGRTYPIYMFGSFQHEDIERRTFFICT